MLFCARCAEKYDYVVSNTTTRSYCQICFQMKDCYNVPAKYLPLFPKGKKKK